MTTVDILFHYRTAPAEQVLAALANTRDVYGIRSLRFDRELQTLRVEYDATRLSAAAVAKLVRATGLEVDEELPLIAPAAPQPEAAPAA